MKDRTPLSINLPNHPPPEPPSPTSVRSMPISPSLEPYKNRIARHVSLLDMVLGLGDKFYADLKFSLFFPPLERAYMMLRMNGDGSDYGSWEAGSYVHEDDEDFDDPSEDEYDDEEDEEEDEDEDAFDVHAHAEAGEDNDSSVGVELDPASFPNDEEYARALQDAEEREMAARLLALAGINDREAEDTDDHGGNSQDTWEELDPDQLSYEELLALGEVVGTESRGLSSDTIASLPSMNYKTQSTQDGNNDSCVICRLDYEDGDTLTVLSCKHLYHSEFAVKSGQCCLDTEFGRDHGQLSGVIPGKQSVVALSGLVEMLIKLDHLSPPTPLFPDVLGTINQGIVEYLKYIA
ncbi:hypothetical protein HYC85_023749 [Camellia sinensis]|uniref:RING-type domain-containing protein n=1 Tax=Camellia sinensis TaxID=4442 RepID=A0A7J7GFG1_CAMSI|nr:hypothetical protein HYC85_023749 [Camellia sinensis]